MRILFLAALLLVSCNNRDVKGMLEVFSPFTLIDEGGRRVTIPVGKHRAEFIYKRHNSEVEMEIKSIDGGRSRDFDFKAPVIDHDDIDISRNEERVRVDMPSSFTRQSVDADALIRNVIISRERPRVYFDRCNGYYGTRDGILGYLKMEMSDDHSRREPSSGHGSLASHIYTVSERVSSQLNVEVAFVDSEDIVAMFKGSRKISYRDLMWEGKCGDYTRPSIRRR